MFCADCSRVLKCYCARGTFRPLPLVLNCAVPQTEIRKPKRAYTHTHPNKAEVIVKDKNTRFPAVQGHRCMFCSCKLPLSLFMCVTQSNCFHLDSVLLHLVGCIMPRIMFHSAEKQPSGICLQRHRPPDPQSYITMAIPKLEH